MDTARVTSKGKVPTPKRVRNLTAIEIEIGDRPALDLDKDESLQVSPVRGAKRSLRGLLSNYAKGRKVEGERIRTVVRKRAEAKHAVR